MKIQELDKTYIAGTYGRFPVTLVSGKGSRVQDENGKEYTDLGSGIAVTSFGIADDAWTKAVTQQLQTLQHTSNLYYTEPCAHLAQMLCEKSGMKKVFFGNSGAEANECAIKVARKYAAEKKGSENNVIITLKNSFHGRTLTTLAATGQEHYHELFQPLTPGFAHAEPNDLSDMERLLDTLPVAGILLECIQGEGGVKVMDDAYLQGVEKLARERDVLLMIDEVQTGNGRTGDFYAYMHAGLHPDVVSTAKGLGGGLPIGACLIGEKAQNVLGPGDHGSTFGGNPAVCAGAVSIVSRVTDELLEQVRTKGEMILETLKTAPGVREVTGRGLMIGILPEKKSAGEVVKTCMGHGVLCLTAKDRVRLLPALNIPEDLLKEALQVLVKALA
ncbi:MAG: acetylornithine/succinylornithine family transaminase [Clostridia bacterium]|nr:acetylornithine/succinylornithine family transaminase [Clostridia bacterium]